MRRRNIFMGGVLLGTTLLCLGMNPGRATVSTAHQPKARTKFSKALKQSWQGRTFIRMTRDSAGLYAIDNSCGAFPWSYSLQGPILRFASGQGELDSFRVLNNETLGHSRVFSVVGQLGDSNRIHCTPLDTLGKLWYIEGERLTPYGRYPEGDRYVDSRYVHTVPVRYYSCDHAPDDSTALCGHLPDEWRQGAIPEPRPQGVAMKVLTEDWQDKDFYLILWEPRVGQYGLRYYDTLRPDFQVRGKVIIDGNSEVPYCVMRRELRGSSLVFTGYRKSDPERIYPISFTSLDSIGAIWDVNGDRCVEGRHLDRVYVKGYTSPRDTTFILYPGDPRRERPPFRLQLPK